MSAPTHAAHREDEDEDLDALWDDGPRAAPAPPQAPPQQAPDSSEEDSYFLGSDDSEDSATRRKREAEARLKDYGPAADSAASAGGSAAGVLPSAADAFTTVEGPPAFLDPEATRPLAVAAHRAAGGGSGSDAFSAGPNKRGQAAGEWDISRMAPQIKELQKPEAGVISGTAVRYRTDDRLEASAAAIALLGGQAREGAEPSGRPPAGPGAAPAGKPDRGKRTAAMPVDSFLDKGVGGAALPRKRQDRKDREKDKRGKGQSTHAVWKSEAEMVLRQQYD